VTDAIKKLAKEIYVEMLKENNVETHFLKPFSNFDDELDEYRREGSTWGLYVKMLELGVYLVLLSKELNTKEKLSIISETLKLLIESYYKIIPITDFEKQVYYVLFVSVKDELKPKALVLCSLIRWFAGLVISVFYDRRLIFFNFFLFVYLRSYIYFIKT
jgi:hypothetical protein